MRKPLKEVAPPPVTRVEDEEQNRRFQGRDKVVLQDMQGGEHELLQEMREEVSESSD